mgnify:CR=1 FL=1
MALHTLDGISPVLPDAGLYWIAPSSDVIGKVRLLRDASVWFHAVLRGDNEWIEVGEGSNMGSAVGLNSLARRLAAVGVRQFEAGAPSLEDVFLAHYQAAEER